MTLRFLPSIPLLCALALSACVTPDRTDKAKWESLAKKIHVGMSEDEVFKIVMPALRSRSPGDAPQQISGGALSGARLYEGYRLDSEYTLHVIFEYPAAALRGPNWESTYHSKGRVCVPPRLERRPLPKYW